jgi:small RNA 2'-O-methyltransferase
MRLDPPEGVTELHEERLDAVVGILVGSGAHTVLDLGCGSGALLERLNRDERFTRIVGIDSSIEAVRQAERRLQDLPGGEGDRLRIVHGSFTESDPSLSGFQAIAMIETIEHIPPERLSAMERVVFSELRPSLVVMTTPNREYNARLRLADDEYRHPHHQFEWCRARFRRWAEGVATRNGYRLECLEIGPRDPLLGSPTQMGVFRMRDESLPTS